MVSRDTLAMADDRFELRLAQESSAIRQEIAGLRADMATRTELEGVRQEIGAVRQEMAAGFGRLERQITESRVDVIKWSFLFWTGQCS